MIQAKLLHWRFLEALDDELYSLSRIIEFVPENFGTFSINVARLYLSVASEVDVVAKLLCATVPGGEQASAIDQYRDHIVKRFPNLPLLRVEIPSQLLQLEPWKDWSENKTPSWWREHNNVKHQRDKFFNQGNLLNLLQASAGLFVLLTYLYQPQLYARRNSLFPNFKMMRIDSRYFHPLELGADWNLPDFGASHI